MARWLSPWLACLLAALMLGCWVMVAADPARHQLPNRIGEHIINADAASYHDDVDVVVASFAGGGGSGDRSGRGGAAGGSSSTGGSGRRSGIQIGSNTASGRGQTGRGQSAIKIGATNTSLRTNISLIHTPRSTSLVGVRPNRTRYDTHRVSSSQKNENT